MRERLQPGCSGAPRRDAFCEVILLLAVVGCGDVLSPPANARPEVQQTAANSASSEKKMLDGDPPPECTIVSATGTRPSRYYAIENLAPFQHCSGVNQERPPFHAKGTLPFTVAWP